jgi:hypothetical protein
MKNCFVLNVPAPDSDAAELYSSRGVVDVFGAIAECWNPDWATFSNSETPRPSGSGYNFRVAGCLTYAATDLQAPLGNFPNFDVTRLSNGSLVTAGPDPLQVTETQIAALVEFLSERLQSAN